MFEILQELLSFFGSVGLLGALISAVCALGILLVFLSLRRRWNVYRRAVRWHERGHLARAYTLLRVTLEKSPNNKQALLLKADIESETGKYAQAEEEYFRLLALKQPGDGIDTFEVKKKLLKPLFHQEKLFDTFKLCGEILAEEKSNAEALYHLGLLYLGQLYYREAYRILNHLLRNRPRFSEAHFAAAVSAVQLRDLDAALTHINAVITEGEDSVAKLVLAGVHFFGENYPACLSVLGMIPAAKRSFETRDQYHFFRKLDAFCHYMKGDYDGASQRFRETYSVIREPPGKSSKPVKKGPVVYNQFGRIGKLGTADQHVEAVAVDEGKNEDRTEESVIQQYYRLKEIAIEGGRRHTVTRRGLSSANALLDMEGLTEVTWVALGFGFSLVRAGKPDESLEFLKKARSRHPEVLGLGKIVDLVDEMHREKRRDEAESGKFFPVSRSTQKIIRKKGRFDLWEYMEAWEKSMVRPYELVRICGFASKKQLSHSLLFGKDSPL